MSLNKILKLAGNVAVCLSLAFVCKKLFELDIDKNLLFRADNLVHIVWISSLYGLIMFVSCVPWMAFLRIITGREISFSEAAWVINKSNLMKYLPGNVFQFIGRNELAIRLSLNHADVAFATVCDIGLLVTASLLTGVLMNLQGMGIWLTRYGLSVFYPFFIIFIITVLLAVFLKLKRNDILQRLIVKLKVFYSKNSAKAIFACFLYFTFLVFLVGALFLAVLCLILRIDISYRMIPSVLSAYMLSWVAGFIIPGAPGGIGIKEATLTLLLMNVVASDSALLAAVIFRFISILGDFCGLLFAWVGIKIRERRLRRG